MHITKESLPKQTIAFTVTIPWKTVSEEKEKVTTTLIKEIELPGFRKGKAPKELAEKQIKQSAVYEEVLKQLTIKAYQDAFKTHQATPFGRPKVEVKEVDEGKDWKLVITVAQKPKLVFGDYKKALAELKKEKKAPKIWTPGTQPEKKDEEKETKPTLGEVLDTLLKEIKAEISDVLVEQENERLLSQLLSDAQRLGLTLERYLSSIGKTSEQLQKEYREQAEKTLTLEFALEELADKENIIVPESEIETFISQAKTEAERKNLQTQRYQITALLRRQKTLERLVSLAS